MAPKRNLILIGTMRQSRDAKEGFSFLSFYCIAMISIDIKTKIYFTVVIVSVVVVVVGKTKYLS